MNDQSIDLIVLPPRDTALEVFSGDFDATIAPFLLTIQSAVEAFKADVSTEEGRKAITSFDYRLARSKTALDAAGKAVVDGLKEELSKKIDANRRRVRLQIEAWQKEVREPLDEWEEADRKRRAKHIETIRLIQQMSLVDYGTDSNTLRQKIDFALAIDVGPKLEEFEEEARVARESALSGLRKALADREAWEAQEAENARLRAIVAAQEAKAAAERAERWAEEKKAREEQEARDRDIREAEAKRQREHQDALAAAQAAQAEAERKIREAESARVLAELSAKEAAAEAERRMREEAEAQAQREFEKEQRRGRIERAKDEATFDIMQVLELVKVGKARLGSAADAMLTAIRAGSVRFVRFEP